MRTINNSKSPYRIGRCVVVTKMYMSGSVCLRVGDVGIISKKEMHNVPDFGLYSIWVYTVDFVGKQVSFGESLVREYMDPA